jgi:3-phosphoshikimate 1-carboxyvinyltransferase
MFAGIVSGPCVVRKPLQGEDCRSTLRCMRSLGVRCEQRGDGEFVLTPPGEWIQPTEALDCGNSGTTMRLLSGLLASRELVCTLVGDESLSRRPMKRIAEPLRTMGAGVVGDHAPLTIHGSSKLRAIDFESPVASAQVKSCVLLAGLRAQGASSVTEPSLSRDHTERMLTAMGASVRSSSDGVCRVTIEPATELSPFEFTVPADISSAAFFMVAAAVLADGRLRLTDLSINPTRTGIFDVFKQAGVPVEIVDPRDELGEPVADIELCAPNDLAPFRIAGPLVPRLIDEIPVLAVMATQCQGISTIHDASELRVKESDRIEAVAAGLRSMGANVETFEDGLAVTGPVDLKATRLDAKGDHRIAMAFAIAGLLAEGETVIDGAETIATSFPEFSNDLGRLVVA